MRLAICDDEALQLDILEIAIRECQIFKVDSLNIERFLSGSELIKSISSGVQYDFIFLDIHMPEKSGLNTYEELTNSPNTRTIFVSTHIENLPEVFALKIPCFLYKPYDQDTFNRTVRIAIDSHNNEYLFNCIKDGKRYIISSKQIRYIEVYNHDLVAYTDKKFSLNRSSLDDLSNLLLPYGFFRCHRSYLINLEYYINHNSNSVKIMGTNEPIKIPLGRERKAKINGAFLKHATCGGYNEC